MRKIDREMKTCFWAGCEMHGKNTAVEWHRSAERSYMVVLLHGNKIAERCSAVHGSFRISLAGWNTKTTKARLNALLEEYRINIANKDGVAYFYAFGATDKSLPKPIHCDPSKWYYVEELINYFYP